MEVSKVFSEFQKVVLFMGDTMSKAPNLSTSQKLLNSIKGILKNKNNNTKSIRNDCFLLRNDFKPISEDDVSLYSFTVKIYLMDWKPEYVREVITTVFQELGLSSVDYVIIQFPPLPIGEDFPLDKAKNVWKAVEEIVKEGATPVVGTADLDKTQLESLYSWAEVKPSLNQINLESCCEMPPDLVAYAKEADIRLHSHSDEKNVLVDESFVQCLKDSGVPQERAVKWRPIWVAKYVSQVKTRSVLGIRGFLMAAKPN